MSTVDESLIRRLAVDGISDEGARAVLVDAIRESGWWDDRIGFVLSNGDDREELLALLMWPGETGEQASRFIVQAIDTKETR